MSGRPLGNRQRADLAARLEAYQAARDEGLDTWQARDLLGVSDCTRAGYERWYRRQAGLPDRPRWIPGMIPGSAADADWRLP